MKNLKSYFVFLSRNKLYSFVNVFGLSVSMMFIIILTSYIVGELSTDKFHTKSDRIHVFGQEATEGKIYYSSAYLIGRDLQQRYPEVEKTCGYTRATYSNVAVKDKKILSTINAADTTFLSMFDFKLLKGDRATALSNPTSAIISQSYATKIFGTEDPMGQTLAVYDSISFVVTGVLEDFKNTTFKETDIIVPFSNMKYFNENMIVNHNNAGSTVTFLQMSEGADLNTKQADIVEYFKTFYWPYSHAGRDEVHFIPLTELYFSENPSIYLLQQGDFTMSMILVVVVSLILLFAVFNYINLTVSQTGFRAKEMATRRLYGLDLKGVILKMINESIIMTFAAMVIGFLMSLSLAPHASELIGKDINLLANLTPFNIALALIFVIVIGIISGLVPATVIIRFKPIDVVKGSFAFKSKMTYSKIFIVIQSVITIALIASSMMIYRQVEHMMSFDYGYNSKAIINIPYVRELNKDAFKNELMKLPSIKRVGFSAGTPLSGSNNNTIKVIGVDNMVSFQVFTLDSASYKMFGFEIIKNNYLDDDMAYYFNEATLRAINASDTVTSVRIEHNGDSEFKIKGIIKDFHINSLSSNDISPAMIRVVDNYHNTSWGKWQVWNVLVETQGDLVQARNDVKRVFTELTNGTEFRGEYIDEQIEATFYDQRRMQGIMLIFTLIAIIISALGLLAMASYFIQQRAKEVAIRKVFGSTRVEVLTRIIWQYLKLVVIAFVIASPIVWYVMSKWLESFSYRIDVSVWIILGAGLVNFAIAFATVYWQGNKVANTNPTKIMK